MWSAQMFGWFKKRRARRRLAFVVGRLPRQLGQDYGYGPTYTVGQVRTVLQALKLAPALHSYAYAGCCSASEFAKSAPTPESSAYGVLRSELVLLYDIAPADFDCTHLLRLRTVPGSAAWNPSAHEAGGPGTGD
jgi:hypothetical protein